MAEFANYYVEFLWRMVQNVWGFIKTIGLSVYKLVVGDAAEYISFLAEHAGGFDFLGWVLLIIASVLHTVLAFFIAYLLFQLIRRYFIFRGKHIEKDKLLEELARLHEQNDRLIREKNKIFKFKTLHPKRYSHFRHVQNDYCKPPKPPNPMKNLLLFSRKPS